MSRTVRTQAELDKALADGVYEINLDPANEYVTFTITAGEPLLVARGSSQPRVVARGSSQPRVVAWGSSQPRVVAWGSSQPRVVARGSSQPRVEAWGSSQPRVEARGSSQPRVEAWGSSQPRVVAWGSSQPRVEAWGSSQPRVVAWGSSQPRVVAWGSSQPRVVARGSSQPRVVARGSSQPRVEATGQTQLSVHGNVTGNASPNVAISITAGKPKIKGGIVVGTIDVTTPHGWADYFGLHVTRGRVTVYKAVDDDYTTPRGTTYTPGTTVTAPDFRDTPECGGGLHFGPSPTHALNYHPGATRFLACSVKLTDLVPIVDLTATPKCKARAAKVLHEVDVDGEVLS